jgi:Family of unknown function (DUF5706)
MDLLRFEFAGGTVLAVHRALMGKRDDDIVRSAGDQVFELLRDSAREGALVFHSYDRARERARGCREIGKSSSLEDGEMRIALLAAWFHDAGYAAGPHGNGVESAAIARRFLTAKGAPAELVDSVVACMRAAADGVLENPAHEVLHDALLVPTAGKDYLSQARLLRLEKERRGEPAVSDVEWIESCVRFVEQHPFRTRYAQLEYNRGRAANLVLLHDLLREQREEAADQRAQAEKAEKAFSNTVEDLYTDISKNQMKLLSIADRRTATMVHVNSIMISLVVALLVRHVDVNPRLLLPTTILLAVNLVVVLICILSMRTPRSARSVLRGLDDRAAAAHDENLLLLVNGMPMTQDEYYGQMEGLARDLPALRKARIDATYFLRRTLNWRGRMLRLTYDVFIVGLFIAVFAFVICVTRK